MHEVEFIYISSRNNEVDIDVSDVVYDIWYEFEYMTLNDDLLKQLIHDCEEGWSKRINKISNNP